MPRKHYIEKFDGVYGFTPELEPGETYLFRGRNPWGMDKDEIPFIISILQKRSEEDGLAFLSKQHNREVDFKKYTKPRSSST